MSTKITTLLIALTLTLPLGASSKKPDANANANASAAASASSARAAEADTKSGASAGAERDTKSYASQPYTAHMHPYAIAADLESRGLSRRGGNAPFLILENVLSPITEAIQHLPPAHKAIIMILQLPAKVSEFVRKQCDEYTQGLCRIIEETAPYCQLAIMRHYLHDHPELLRPLNEQQKDVTTALNGALPQDFVKDLFRIVADYYIPGFRYGRSVTDVPGDVSDISCRWDRQGIDDLTNLGTGHAQVPRVNKDGKAIKIVGFCGNPIRYLPECLGANLCHIELFNCGDCLIEAIHPQAFAGMEKLWRLELTNNLLTELPDEIYALPALQVINLTGNPLSDDTKRKLEAWKRANAERNVLYDKKAKTEK